VKRREYHGHGSRRQGTRLPEYEIWAAIIQRCTNPNNQRYSDYGGRGVAISDLWRNSFSAFLADVGRRPSPELSLDRIKNDRGYEPGNVRWATSTEQRLNSRRRRFITAFGKTLCLKEWSLERGIPQATILRRIAIGVPPEMALTAEKFKPNRYENSLAQMGAIQKAKLGATGE
jgi:hypothetical protein